MLEHTDGNRTEVLEFWFNGLRLRAIIRSSAMWFVLIDIAEVLETTTQQLLSMLPPEETGHHAFNQSVIKGKPIVSQAGLVRIAMQRKGQKARALAAWLMDEFLPNVAKVTNAGKASAVGSLLQQVALLSLHVTSLNRRVAELETGPVRAAMVRQMNTGLSIVPQKDDT